MKIDIKASQLDLSPALREYVEEKIGSLDKFMKRWETEGEINVHVEVDRTTHHHHKGEVFRAVADVELPKKMIRVEEYHADLRAAIDTVKDVLKRELVKYKEMRESNRE